MQLNELDALNGLVSQIDATATPTPEPMGADGQPLPPPPPPPDYINEAAGAVDMFAALVVGYCPAAEVHWSAEAKARISAALGPVMEKYGVTFGNLPPEITLLIVAGPPLYQSSKLLAAQMAAEKQTKKPAEVTNRGPAQPLEDGTAPAPLVHPQMGLYPPL